MADSLAVVWAVVLVDRSADMSVEWMVETRAVVLVAEMVDQKGVSKDKKWAEHLVETLVTTQAV